MIKRPILLTAWLYFVLAAFVHFLGTDRMVVVCILGVMAALDAIALVKSVGDVARQYRVLTGVACASTMNGLMSLGNAWINYGRDDTWTTAVHIMLAVACIFMVYVQNRLINQGLETDARFEAFMAENDAYMAEHFPEYTEERG